MISHLLPFSDGEDKTVRITMIKCTELNTLKRRSSCETARLEGVTPFGKPVQVPCRKSHFSRDLMLDGRKEAGGQAHPGTHSRCKGLEGKEGTAQRVHP